MSVEIKELVIRAVAQGATVSDRSEEAKGRTSERAESQGSEKRDEIIEAAVKEVLRILRTAKER